MKLSTTILFLLLFCKVYGQKSHSDNIDKGSNFNYEYWFQFENLEDTASYHFVKKAGQQESTIELTNNKGDSVLFARIRIKGLENDTLVNIISDLHGLGRVKLSSGKYQIEIAAVSYDKFLFDFAISEGEYFDLKIKLGLAPELTVYQINAKNELKEQEIQTIINCVKTNRQDYKICSKKNRYNIMKQI